MTLAWLVLAVTSASLAALASFPALAWERWKRAVVLAAVAMPIALSPLWIPAGAPLARLLATMHATALLVKLYDLLLAAPRSPRPGFLTFALFLANWFSVVWRRLGAEPMPTFRESLVRLGRSAVGTLVAVLVVVWLFRREWSRVPFVIEHGVKSTAFFLALIPGTAVGTSIWRLAGGRARDFMEAPLLAPTPAAFWRRYNRPAQQFFHEDVFKPAGGLKSPVRATLATFAVSALIHEYVFGISLGRMQGYQTVFFLLQGLGVAATLRLRPAKWKVWPCLAATWLFNLATSVFFFASMNGIFPFYSQGLPKWLAGWGW